MQIPKTSYQNEDYAYTMVLTELPPACANSPEQSQPPKWTWRSIHYIVHITV